MATGKTQALSSKAGEAPSAEQPDDSAQKAIEQLEIELERLKAESQRQHEDLVKATQSIQQLVGLLNEAGLAAEAFQAHIRRITEPFRGR